MVSCNFLKILVVVIGVRMVGEVNSLMVKYSRLKYNFNWLKIL